MLEPMFHHKPAFDAAYGRFTTEPRTLYFNVASWVNYTKECPSSEWNEVNRVSIDKAGVLHGFFSASIDRDIRGVSAVAIGAFIPKSRVFAADLCRFALYLMQYERVEWSVIVGNPADRMYEKAIPVLRATVIGTKRFEIRLPDGKLYHRKFYEWFPADTPKAGIDILNTIAGWSKP